jgi:hypothetical protein
LQYQNWGKDHKIRHSLGWQLGYSWEFKTWCSHIFSTISSAFPSTTRCQWWLRESARSFGGARKSRVVSMVTSRISRFVGCSVVVSMVTSRISRFLGCSVVVSMVTSRISRFVGCSVLRRCS